MFTKFFPHQINSQTGGGVWFCNCWGLPIVPSGGGIGSSTQSGFKPLIISGKRARTVDTHAHCYFQAGLDLMGAEATTVLPPVKGVPAHFLQQDEQLNARFAAMDKMGIDMQVLSINPFWYKKNREIAQSICKIHNESFAELCAQHPKRFSAFASLPMQFPDLAVEMLEEAVKKYKLKGAAIGSCVAGVDFSHPQFHPVLATTIALQKLIFEGVFDKFPKLKILGAHGGGFLGSYAPRMDRGCFVSPQNCDPEIVLRKKPTEYLRQIYFDSLVFTGEALRHLVAEVGASQVMIGTDHPIPWVDDPVGHVMNTPELNDQDRLAILGENAIDALMLDI